MKKPIKIQKVPKVERIRKGMGNSLINSLMSPTSLHTTPIERLEIISESRNLLLIEMDRLKLPHRVHPPERPWLLRFLYDNFPGMEETMVYLLHKSPKFYTVLM